jgi:DNA-binding PadR family transcriptional regulator
MTEQKPEHLKVTVQEYGYFDNPLTHQLANELRFESWVEADKKRRAYWATPEGKAELERERVEREARWERETKFAKRWQWLHNKLVSKGCECNHDDCGGW